MLCHFLTSFADVMALRVTIDLRDRATGHVTRLHPQLSGSSALSRHSADTTTAGGHLGWDAGSQLDLKQCPGDTSGVRAQSGVRG